MTGFRRLRDDLDTIAAALDPRAGAIEQAKGRDALDRVRQRIQPDPDSSPARCVCGHGYHMHTQDGGPCQAGCRCPNYHAHA